MDAGVYSIYGAPGVPPDAGGTNGTGDWGALYINYSADSSETIIGPTWPDNADGVAQPSNYYDVNDLLGASSLTDGSSFGKSVSAISSSQGAYILASAPGLDVGGNSNAGAVFLFLSNSSGMTGVHKFTGSATNSYIGAASATQDASRTLPTDGLSLADDSSGNIYISYYDNDSNSIKVNKSSSVGGIEFIASFAPDPTGDDPSAGISHEMDVSADGDNIYIITANEGLYGSNRGRALLYSYKVSTDSLSRTFIQPDDISDSDYFAKCSPDITSGSDGLYIALSKMTTPPYSLPIGSKGYLFFSNSSGVTQKSTFTGSGISETTFFGANMKIVSSSNTPLYVIATEIYDYDNSDGNQAGRIWIYETGSSTSNVYYIDEGYDAGQQIDAIRKDNSLHIVSGDDYNNNSKGKGYYYEWGLSGSCSQQQAGEPAGGNTTMTKGIAVFDANGNQVHKFESDGSVRLGLSGSEEGTTDVTIGSEFTETSVTIGSEFQSGSTQFYTDVFLQDDENNSLISRMSSSDALITSLFESSGSAAFDRLMMQADIDQNEADGDTDRALIRTEMEAESVVREAAEAALQADVDQNETDADAAIAALQADVDANEADSDAAEAAIQADVDANETASDAADATELARALAAEAAIQADVNQNESDGDTDRALIRTEMTANETARDASEAAAITAAVDGLIDGAPGTLDTLNELAAALGDDADYHNSITTLLGAATTDRAAVRTEFAAADATELARALAAEAVIQADVDQNETDADAADATELARALAAEAAIQADVNQNEADADTADAAATTDRALIRTEVEAESVTREAAEAALQADVDQNETDADAAIAALQADVDANEADSDAADATELARALAAEAVIQADVNQNESDGDTDRALIRTEFAAADQIITDQVDANYFEQSDYIAALEASASVLYDRTAGMVADDNSGTLGVDDNVMFSVGTYAVVADIPGFPSEGSVMYWAGSTEGGFVADKLHFYENGTWYPSPFTSPLG
jgi:hypothetical protein